MRAYLEAIETTVDSNTTESEFVRIDVTGMTKEQRADIQTMIEDIMTCPHYRIVFHLCGHEDKSSCSMELVKEY